MPWRKSMEISRAGHTLMAIFSRRAGVPSPALAFRRAFQPLDEYVSLRGHVETGRTQRRGRCLPSRSTTSRTGYGHYVKPDCEEAAAGSAYSTDKERLQAVAVGV
ncbi:hypothetical protein MAPG_08523 [Magnaporthiopsis poae ATCC 64411]|uniref:Uncharacterized protein n=1 Tax=Magnaporthiopsis poae (strain ATCC 64411 / 73-15) TaxID=644358 RepID=A0A0C4E7L0_MAGP6|nr:hypothetical protein MAPG_08523 [Magnaporthiopsis poae ATCC 64411]